MILPNILGTILNKNDKGEMPTFMKDKTRWQAGPNSFIPNPVSGLLKLLKLAHNGKYFS